jgi:hypothetical protein
LKFIYNKTKDRHFEESLLPICGVQHNIGGSISLLLARIQYGNDISQTTTNKRLYGTLKNGA